MANLKIYKDGTPFTGVIGRTAEESSPAWPGSDTPPGRCTQCHLLRA